MVNALDNGSLGVVVLIDDGAVERMVVPGILDNIGYTVYAASSGQEGVEFVRQHRPDFVVCDCVMEGMDGPQTVAAIRKLADVKQPYILSYSGTHDDMVRGQCLAAGADYYMAGNKATIDYESLLGEKPVMKIEGGGMHPEPGGP